MRPLLLNTTDLHGGAAIATYRLHQGLRRIGVDSSMLVQHKTSSDVKVIGPESKLVKLTALARPYLDRLPVETYRHRDRSLFSPAVVPDSLAGRVARIDPDLVHLCWITAGFVRIETLRHLRRPVLWTLHDMWAFTGGCHYDNGCGRYREACGTCPVLGSTRTMDLSSRVWSRKRRSWKQVPITIVAPSRWLADCARASSLFGQSRIEVLPNGIDEARYKPADRTQARAACNLPQDKQLILFSAMNATSDPRKGFQFLLPALQQMASEGWGEGTELVVMGASQPQDGVELGIKAHYVGHLHDEISQALLYSAVDVMVAPSVQENLSNSVMESLACGTPVVAFDIGGMPDMIRHRSNGWLAQPFLASDLARGICWVLEDEARHASLELAAREYALAHYRLEAVAGAYRSLYEDVCAPA